MKRPGTRCAARAGAGPRRRTSPALAALLLAACGAPGDFGREATFDPPARAAIATEHPLATQAGLDVLARGGNAADAAVAAALVLAVVHPQAGNLGGGGFALWVPHTGEAWALDFREAAPSGASPAPFLDAQGRFVPERATSGPLAVAVPGSPHGLERLAREAGSGRFTLEQLAAPAVRLAREGFAIDAWLAHDLAQPDVLEEFNPAARALFFPRGRPLREGDRLVQPDLARTLQRFGREGAEALQVGEVARAVCAALAAAPIPRAELGGALEGAAAGWITPADLAGYRAERRAPLRGWFRGRELVCMPPPSSGGVVLLQTLGVLEGLPLDPERDGGRQLARFEPARAQAGEDPGLTPRMLHWWIEALRGAFADRARHLGDPESMQVAAADLLAPAAIAARRVAIGERAQVALEPLEPAPREGGETTHLSVLDAQGNAVALTTTLNTTFGSGILVPGAGFLLNDEIDDFAIVPDVPNTYGLVGGSANALLPRRRPLSSMTPTVVRDGGHANVLVIGSPGGPRIISSVAQVILRWTVLEQPIGAALEAPRLHQQWNPAATRFEPGFAAPLVDALAGQFAQPVERARGGFGSVQAIALERIGGEPLAVSDPRRGGTAAVLGGEPSRPARPGAWLRSRGAEGP